MTTDSRWQPFGIQPETWENDGHEQLITRAPGLGDRSGTWLRCAMLALGLLAAAAAAVSFEAQYRMVLAAKGIEWAAALEAGIPDAAALVFASLGIALALRGRRAVRPRVLNVGAVGTSIAMNLLAAQPGWRDLAIWVMPPIAYALASDTAIGVIRAYAIARQRELNEALAEDETTPLAIIGGLALWTLRLALAPPSTLRGFRAWVVEECPVAPGRRELPAAVIAALPAAPAPVGVSTTDEPAGAPGTSEPAESAEVDEPQAGGRHREPVGESKTARFLQLVKDQHGPLAAIDPAHVSRIASDLAPEVGLHPGSARSALRPLVLAAQTGHSS